MRGTEPVAAPPSATPLKVVGQAGPGRFVTKLVLEGPRGERHVWVSRRNRKGLDRVPVDHVRWPRPRHLFAFVPRSATWWIPVLFMVGSVLFALGSGICLRGGPLEAHSGGMFFTGSFFFTGAAYLQLYEVINEPDSLSGRRPAPRLWRWEPAKIAWWETAIQLVGTLLFNVSTFEATRTLGSALEDELVWSPNVLGSLCFLISSYLAYAEVCHRWLDVQWRNVSWWLAFANLIGSIAFGISAIASYVVPATGQLLSDQRANLWTLVGAVCFFAGAYLLLPEMTAHHAPRPEHARPFTT